MKAEPRVIAALAERGIDDLSLVVIDVWTYGKALMPPQWQDRRLGWADIWLRSSPHGNPYANPVSGLKLIVDMNTMELLQMDEAAVAPPAPVMGEYEPDLVPGQVLRDDLKALHITQPDGVSFQLDGNELRWQNWSLRVGFNYREGLVLHQIGYDDHGTHRDIANRISLAEMIVPYRDSSFDHYRRTAYDIGEWGLGYMTTSLRLGCDCLGEIRYLDATLADSAGVPYVVPQAICIHEEDNAVLWKHVDNNGRSEVRRMRRLVVSVHATVANYEYLIYWRFYTDGNIECEIRATGIMVTTPIAPGAPTPATGTLVDHRTYAPFHQHFLVARLDLDVDGPENSVLEVDSFAPEARTGQPVWAGHANPGHADRVRGGRGARLRLRRPTLLEGQQSAAHQRVRHPRCVQIGPGRGDSADDGAGHPAVPAGSRHRPHAVGHQAPRRREVALRNLSDTERERRRHHPLDRRR